LQIFADHAAAAIKNARLYQGEQEQRKLAEALTKAAATLTSSLDLEDLLDRILEQVMNVIPCKAANILMIRDDHVYVRRHRGYEQFPQYTAEVENIKIPISTPNIQYMLTNNEGLLIPDTTKYPYWEVLPGVEWIKGYAGNPLKVDGEIVGFLSIDSDTPDFFTEDTIYGLKIFADYASAAIKNARAFESSIRRTEEMAALVAAASTVSRSLDYIQVLQVVAEQMANTLGVVTCAISDYDPEANQVTLLLEHRPDGWDVGPEWYQPFDLNEYPITRQVLLDHKPVHLRNDDPDLHESERQFMEKSEIGSLLLLPLVSQDRTLGLVELMDVDKDREFSEQDIALGLSLASHAAIAIENADLYRRLQDHASTLEERVQQRTQELQEATDYIEGILASVPDAVFVLDQNQQLIRANQSGQLLLEQAQTTGLNLFNPKLLDILEDGGIPDMQSILEVQERAYQALSSQLITDDGTISGQIIVFRDVTTFRELDQMKTQFVSDVSHELRTPLTNLTLYLGLLTTVRDPQKQNEYILTLQRETDRLAHLIEDLLTISRLEASRIQFQIRATNLNQLVEDLILDRTILATQKNIELNFTPGVDLPLVSADVNMLTQALSNLLTNATNYTLPDGKVQVSTDHPEPDWITIQIADTGVGIPSDEIERVFDRFYRGSASQHTGAAGTGLGLAIAQEIIHRLGGKITLKTNPGEGSAFTVWLKPAPEDLP
jgi:signal transduction histidine kinase